LGELAAGQTGAAKKRQANMRQDEIAAAMWVQY